MVSQSLKPKPGRTSETDGQMNKTIKPSCFYLFIELQLKENKTITKKDQFVVVIDFAGAGWLF